MFPQYRKENTLHSVCQNFGFQSSKHESGHATLRNDVACNLRIGQLFRMRLFVHLHDTNRIRTRIRYGGGTKAQNGTTTQLSNGIVLFWNFLRQEIVGKEPWVVTDKCGGCGSKGTIVETVVMVVGRRQGVGE